MNSLGVVVGRFQSPFVHHGYVQLFEYLKERHPHRLVVVGASPTKGTKRDPLDVDTRAVMLSHAIPDAHLASITDRESDKAWSEALDKLICEKFPWAKKPGAKVVLYGGRDSFIPRYHGRFKTHEFKTDLKVASTRLREECGKQAPLHTWPEKHSEYFRRGVIYSAQNAFPRTFPTVDIAVTLRPSGDNSIMGNRIHLLLGKKFKTDERIRFPGGFVDPTDESLEMAAKREIMEEAPGIATEGPMIYVGSTLVNDWRYRGQDRIMTSLFHTEYTWGHTKAGDDLAEVAWHPFDPKTRDKIEHCHQPLYDMLKKYMKETYLRNLKLQEFVDANLGWK